MANLVLHSVKPSALCSIFLFLLLSSIVSVVNPSKDDCSSSCGQLQNIRPPFRLKGDPDYCGDHNYELICDGNHTVLNILSCKYYVLKILTEVVVNAIQVVDVSLASGGCHLPSQSLSPRVVEGSKYHIPWPSKWVSFVNCTSIIQSNAYWPVSCMSQNGMFVYLIYEYKVMYLEPSCSLLAMIPSLDVFNEKSEIEVFEHLQLGFILSWYQTPTFGYCLEEYFSGRQYKFLRSGGILWTVPLYIFLQIEFVTCVYESKGIFVLPIAIAFVLLLHLLGIALLIRFIFAPISIWVFLAYEYSKMCAPVDAIEKFLQNQQLLTPTRYAYNDIITITSHFKEKLGQGGFGSVFKGNLPHGQLVAVKMLGKSKCNGDDFINEVSTIGRIHHKNVVQLLGFCSEGSKRALVYEYMPHGSLDKHIFSSDVSNQRCFSWDKLNDIAFCVAEGIDYLHRGCDMTILHFDIKPHNILLDQSLNPKISDFGLAKLYPKDYSMVSISVARGTVGYIAPELISRNFGVISHKSDVYSYGMLLLEIAGGRRNVNPRAENSSQIYYPSWIYDRLNQREGLEGLEVDNITEIGEAERKLLTEIGEIERKLCKVGLWCIQMKPSIHPSISKVLEMLEADANTLPMPPKPFFSSPQPTLVRGTCLDSSLNELFTISDSE